METHSLGAAAIAAAVTLAIMRRRDPRLAVAVFAAWASHVLFDWLGSDTTPPIGVMALWPISSRYYFADAFFFDAITRRYWLEGFWWHNLLALLKEIVMLGPVVVLLAWLRRRARVGRG
jgi:hypothetical protein